MVGIRAGEVDFLVCHVQIAAEDDGFGFRQAADVGAEGLVPFAAVGQASQLVLGVGGVAVDEVELFELHGGDAAFRIMLRHADAEAGGEGGHFGEDEHAGVSGALGGVPERMRPGCQPQVAHLLRAGFDFLKAEHVCIKRIHFFRQAFAEGGAQAVHIPADDFHGAGV